MMIDVDRWLRRLWMVNGVFLLLLLVLAVGALSYSGLSFVLSDDAAEVALNTERAANPRDLSPRAVRFSAPEAIRGTETRIVSIHHGSADMSISMVELYSGPSLAGLSRSESARGPLINVLFLRPDGTAHLLFRRPVIIREVDHPRRTSRGLPGASEDTTGARRTWIAYDVVEEDTNGNGRLDPEDRSSIHVTDLEGSGLRRVLGDQYWPEAVVPFGDGSRLLVYALEPLSDRDRRATERMRQRAFTYDPASGRLSAYAVLDSLTQQAAGILAK